MAVKITTKVNTSVPNAAYPYGDIKDDSGANDGTPVNQLVYADFHQFFARLIDQSSFPNIVINDLPDNDTNDFQFYEALLATKTNHSLQNEALINTNITSIGTNLTEINKIKARLIGGDFSTF